MTADTARQAELSRVVVFTMGRVGSKSIAESLEASLGRRVYHVHSIDPVTLGRQVANAGSLDDAADSVRIGVSLVRDMVSSNRHTRFVSLVRDPIERNLSAAFTSVRKRMGDTELRDFVEDPSLVRQHWAAFYDRRPFVWFDREVRDVLGLDVFETPFPDEGYQSWSEAAFDFLVIRSELGRADKEQALRSFFDDHPIALFDVDTVNRSLTAYESFKRNVGLDEAYVKGCWSTKFRKHFYPEVTLEAYVEKWSG